MQIHKQSCVEFVNSGIELFNETDSLSYTDITFMTWLNSGMLIIGAGGTFYTDKVGKIMLYCENKHDRDILIKLFEYVIQLFLSFPYNINSQLKERVIYNFTNDIICLFQNAADNIEQFIKIDSNKLN